MGTTEDRFFVRLLSIVRREGRKCSANDIPWVEFMRSHPRKLREDGAPRHRLFTCKLSRPPGRGPGPEGLFLAAVFRGLKAPAPSGTTGCRGNNRFFAGTITACMNVLSCCIRGEGPCSLRNDNSLYERF